YGGDVSGLVPPLVHSSLMERVAANRAAEA
ncbi:MAG: hypothetical protein JWN08_2038, partial [Frankiales bacterium]|nr:hypothetical protein [Frankiales bacterium]